MKNISELGLELIELEDQVLLVDPSEPCQEEDWIYWNKRPVKAIDTTYSKATKYIITSTKPLEGLPLLVIEDEIEEIINESGLNPYGYYYVGGFKDGYNKAKETYKFTEEDLRKALLIKHSGLSNDYVIQSLTKKEFYISCFDNRKIKIDNNKIFGLWK